MNSKFKKILKYFLIGIGSLLLLIFIAIGIAFNFVFTPEKITPKIVNAVNKQLNAELQLNSVELSFFSTFPDFSLELKNGVIINQINDSVPNIPLTKHDTLIAFNKGSVTINPTAFLIDKKIDIKHLIFEQPQIYAYVNKNGKVNWDIMKEDPEKDTITKTKEPNAFKANIDFDDITIIDGSLYYDDENSDVYANLEDLDVNLKVKYNQKKILLEIDLNTDKLTFTKKDDKLIEDLSLGISGKIDVDRKSKVIVLDKTKVRINDIEFVANGQLLRDIDKKEVDVQLDLALEVPSLKTIIELIPDHILQKRKDFISQGTIISQAKINGIYGNGKFPKLQANLNIKDGSISYKNRSGKIDLIETDISVYLDPSKETPSFIDIPNFKIKGDGIDLIIHAKVEDALADAKVTTNAKGRLDLTSISKTFPLKDYLKISGLIDTDIDAVFYPKDFKNKNYGNIYVLGKLSLKNLLVNYKNDSLIFAAKESKAVFIKDNNSKLLTSKSSKVLGARLDLKGFKLNVKNEMNITADVVFAEFGTTPLKNKNQIATLASNLRIENAHFKLGDSIKGMIKKANAQIKLKPSEKDKTIPCVHAEFFIDSAGIKANGKFFAITDGNYKIDAYRKAKKRWPITGQITFNKMYAFTPAFPLVVKMPQTKITIKPGIINLNHAKMQIGNSDIEVTGKIYDLGKTIFDKDMFKAELAIKSNVIDVNELIATLNKGIINDDVDIEKLMTESEKNKTQETRQPKTFVIPKRIDFKFSSSIARVMFKDSQLKNIYGLITIKDQTIDLKNLKATFKRAKMTTKIQLIAKDKIMNSLAFDFKLNHIDLNNLLSLMPVLDTLLPMSKSFKGNVNFRIKGISKLNDDLGIITPTLDAIARIEGENIIVFDSETFTSLSKKLMFKNKKENKIDHISVEILMKDKTIEVLPAEIVIDRYKFAVGGKNKLDMTYNYQISILKSPLPFKAGVDIIGDADDYKIKLTKAKFKYLFSNKKRHQKKIDSTIIKRKQAILRQLPF